MKSKTLLFGLLLLWFCLIVFAVGFDVRSQGELTQYDFIIIIHNDGWFISNTVYYSDDPPMYGSNCVMFIDAITGLLIVEIAPRITARSTEPITKGATEKKKPRRYLLCKR